MSKVAVVISSQHAIPHGGIGQFARCITEFLIEQGHEVHILLDKKPRYTFLTDVADRTFYNLDPLKTEANESMFEKQGVDPAKIQNFLNIIQKTQEFNYDVYIINTPEAFDSISQIQTTAKVVFYTHMSHHIYPDQLYVFDPKYVEYFNPFLLKDFIVGTQSEHNRAILTARGVRDCRILPMPMPDKDLLTSSQGYEKSGVLYIGPHDPRKNYPAYIKIMQKLKLPCRVMTTPKGKTKFEQSFKKAGITDYDIRVSISGKEKIDFIKGSKLVFNTSLSECYPFAFLETVGHMPVVVLDKQSWTDNFDSRFYHKVNIKDAAEKITELYNKPYDDSALEYILQLEERAKQAWIDFFKE